MCPRNELSDELVEDFINGTVIGRIRPYITRLHTA